MFGKDYLNRKCFTFLIIYVIIYHIIKKRGVDELVPLSVEGSSVATILAFGDNLVLNIALCCALVVLLMLSAFFSSSETAYSTANLIRLKNYQDEKRKGAKKAVYIAENFDVTLITLLVGNNIVNIAATTIATIIFSSFISNEFWSNFANVVVMTLLVLTFGEIIPKSIAKRKPEELALKFSGVFYIVMKLLMPISFLFHKLRKAVIKEEVSDEPFMTEDELENVIDVMEDQGVLDENDAELISNSLSLNDKTVYDIMTPRVDMICVNIEDSVLNIRDIFFEYQYSRLPVYRDDKGNIVGLLRERDFFTALIKYGADKVNINKLITKPYFVSKATKVDDLIRDMQKAKQHFGVVVDEYGGTDGIVTLEDCLEEIVGEIYDEYDDEEKIVDLKEIGENKYLISAEMELEDLFEQLELGKAPLSEYSNVGGFIYDLCEELPQEGMHVEYESVYEKIDLENPISITYNLNFLIKQVKERRIRLVELSIEVKEDNEEEKDNKSLKED